MRPANPARPGLEPGGQGVAGTTSVDIEPPTHVKKQNARPGAAKHPQAGGRPLQQEGVTPVSHSKIASPPRTTPRCERCDTKYRGKHDWNVRATAGRVVGLICPRCQTTEENAEAEINEATLIYDADRAGRIVAKPKVGV